MGCEREGERVQLLKGHFSWLMISRCVCIGRTFPHSPSQYYRAESCDWIFKKICRSCKIGGLKSSQAALILPGTHLTSRQSSAFYCHLSALCVT